MLRDGMKQTSEAITDAVEIKVVGKSGQMSLGKKHAGKTLRLRTAQRRHRRADGGGPGPRTSAVDARGAQSFADRARLAWADANEPREPDVDSC